MRIECPVCGLTCNFIRSNIDPHKNMMCFECEYEIPGEAFGRIVNLESDLVSARELLNEILDFQIANRGSSGKCPSPNAFYRCYTFPTGEMPKWVLKAENFVNKGVERKRKVKDGND